VIKKNDCLVDERRNTGPFDDHNTPLRLSQHPPPVTTTPPSGYHNTPLRLPQHPPPVTPTPQPEKVTREMLAVLKSKKSKNLLGSLSAFDLYQYDSKRAIFDVDYQI
jgi:hypothetical protein